MVFSESLYDIAYMCSHTSPQFRSHTSYVLTGLQPCTCRLWLLRHIPIVLVPFRKCVSNDLHPYTPHSITWWPGCTQRLAETLFSHTPSPHLMLGMLSSVTAFYVLHAFSTIFLIIQPPLTTFRPLFKHLMVLTLFNGPLKNFLPNFSCHQTSILNKGVLEN